MYGLRTSSGAVDIRVHSLFIARTLVRRSDLAHRRPPHCNWYIDGTFMPMIRITWMMPIILCKRVQPAICFFDKWKSNIATLRNELKCDIQIVIPSQLHEKARQNVQKMKMYRNPNRKRSLVHSARKSGPHHHPDYVATLFYFLQITRL